MFKSKAFDRNLYLAGNLQIFLHVLSRNSSSISTFGSVCLEEKKSISLISVLFSSFICRSALHCGDFDKSSMFCTEKRQMEAAKTSAKILPISSAPWSAPLQSQTDLCFADVAAKFFLWKLSCRRKRPLTISYSSIRLGQ